MSNGRLIQNLRGGRALIVTEGEAAIAALDAMLIRLAINPVYVRPDSVPSELDPERDVLIVDGDLAPDLSLPLSPIAQLPPAPVVGLVGIEAPSQLRQLMALGATAFLRKPVHHGSIYSSLFLCVNEYRRRLALEQQLQELQHRRSKRRFVIKAVLDVIRRTGVDDDTAYVQLRRDSMRARQSLEDYCEAHMLRSAAMQQPATDAADTISSKEGYHESQHIPQTDPGHDAGRAAEPGLDPGPGSRPDQAWRA